MTARRIFVSLVAVLLCGSASAQSEKQAPPKIAAKLYAPFDAIEPGSTTQLAVEIDLEKPWHMYHPIIIDTGLPTRVQFTGPAGATIRALHYPRPSEGDLAGIRYLEYDGKFIILADLDLEKDYPVGTPLALSAKISGLACIEACVPVEVTAAITIPVSASRGGAINAAIFESAAKMMPKTLADAPYLKGSSARFEKPDLAPGDKTDIAFELKVQAGHHILDRDPGVEGFIGTEIFIESADGLKLADAKNWKWPEPRVKSVAGVGTLRELSGTVTVRIPVELTDDKFPSGKNSLRALVKYQCCKDEGVCFAPEIVEATLDFTAATFGKAEPTRAMYIVGEPAAATGSPSPNGASSVSGAANIGSGSTGGAGLGFFAALMAAFLGGLILNVMPCVLPVISIKIVSFVQQSHEDPRRIFRLGLAFSLGVLAWFWLMAIISAAPGSQLRASLQNPLQNSTVTFTLANVIFLMALNMFGVFEIILPGGAAGKLDQAASKEGYPGAFFKGFLATLLGTACTAPFLVTGLAYAFTQPLVVSLPVFTSAGLGMASPYLLLSANPKWLKFVPKPGKWMETFKQAMGFALVATAIYLLWILRKPMFADGVVWTVAFWGFLSFAAWLVGRIRFNWSMGAALTTWAAAACVVLGGFQFSMRYMYDPAAARAAAERGRASMNVDALVKEVAASDWKRIPWQEYHPGLAEALSEKGYTVYVDYTADWCPSCKFNTGTVLESDHIRSLMKELRVIPIEADFSGEDPDIRKDLDRFGHLSVPMNLLYPAGKPNEIIKLDVLLTKAAVESALRRAGASRGDATASSARPGGADSR